MGDKNSSTTGEASGTSTGDKAEPSTQASQNGPVNLPPAIVTAAVPSQTLGTSASGNVAIPNTFTSSPSHHTGNSSTANIGTRRPRGDSLGSDPGAQSTAPGSHSIPIPIPATTQMSPQGYPQQFNNMTSPGSYTNPNTIMANMTILNNNYNNSQNNNPFNAAAGGPGDKVSLVL